MRIMYRDSKNALYVTEASNILIASALDGNREECSDRFAIQIKESARTMSVITLFVSSVENSRQDVENLIRSFFAHAKEYHSLLDISHLTILDK